MSGEIHRPPPVRFENDRPVPPRFDHKDRIQTVNVDSAALAAALKREIKGEVRFDNGSRALYSTDASNYRQVPIGAVMPHDANDVIATVALARKFGAPILARGGGTSLAGQCCNVAVVMDFSKYMNRILELDPKGKFARVEPGLVLDDLRNAAEEHQLTFGPDPATHSRCTIGGMIGNNSCGVHALMAGKTVDNIEELDILTYDGVRLRVGATTDAELTKIISEGGRRGDIYRRLRAIRDKYGDEIRKRYPKIPRRVSGYNLDSLLPEDGFNVAKALVGSECTCVVVLQAKCKLVYSPPARTLVVLGYEDIYIAADDVPRLLEFKPIGLEGIDDRLVNDMKEKKLNLDKLPLLPRGKGWLLVEFGGDTKEEADANAQKMMDALKQSSLCPSMKRYDDKRDEKRIWKIRESGLGATAFVPGKPRTWEGWEDSAVDPKHLGKYLRDLRKLLDKYNYVGDLYGHFGQACVHTRNNFDLESAEGIRKYRSYIDEAADLCIRYNGSLSGEHGDGQSRAELLPKMFGNELIEAFREFKSIWDPDWRMNPGKVVTPYHPTENLHLGADFHPWSPKTHFKFPEDEGRIDRAILRCVGVGECRRMDGGTMCPSYMATHEEEHSTRGRARLLFEMFEGQTIPSSWRNEAVKDALDLCLSCKGCKGDCPVNVDMATYKAEFLSHYYKWRLRPLPAYTMGWIHRWSRIASMFPGLSNAMMSMSKPLLGIAPQRKMPKYAKKTFRAQFRPNGKGERVLLFPDTFNNYFHPDTALAAAEVLERAGYQVVIPKKNLCCGRPLYDWGFLRGAKKLLREAMRELQPEIDRGTPIVGLEPSCISVFRDELGNLFPGRSVPMHTLSEFIHHAGDSFRVPQLKRKAIVQGHCHHKAIMKFEPEEEVLKKMGVDFEHLDSGCCGMAGAFGFERKHYDISMRIGERVLLPRVRESAEDTLIIADGFSCREQIEQSTGRRALHLAEVLAMGSGLTPPIADYAIIGCTRSAALISRDGSIDWLCWPRFDSPSLFARILDHNRGGFFAIRPACDFQSSRRYVPRTNVLETTFECASGTAKLIDLMPVMREEDKRHLLTPFRQLLRRIEGVEGEVPIEVQFSPRTKYAQSSIDLKRRGDTAVCEQIPIAVHLRSDVRLDIDGPDATARFTLRKGDSHDFALGFDDRSPAVMPHIGKEATEEIARTVDFWRAWGSQFTYEGQYSDEVLRSALVLKLLTYAPSGGIVAAPTTSLPEKIGGIRNWDYRYCWLRDAAFTVSALDDCGFTTEGGAFVDWMLYATRLTHPHLQVLYDVFGESHIPEKELHHLEGYRQSSPVRVGNGAHDQFQLDIYGEVLGGVEEHLEPKPRELYRDVKHLLVRLADVVTKRWHEPDSGIWEKRSERKQHVHAKVMAWAALDCAVRLVEKQYIPAHRVEVWRSTRDEIHRAVLERGFNAKLGSFVSIFDGDELDSSLLYMSRVGFLEGDDPRLVGTIDTIRNRLGHDDLLYRYEERTDDGLPPGEGAFLACSFWLVEALTLAHREAEARQLFEKLLKRANDVGLYSEEIDVESGALLGNFPQALTHIGMMNAALCLDVNAGRKKSLRSPHKSYAQGS